MPDGFWRDSISPNRSLPVHPAKDIPTCDFGICGPFIDCPFHPCGHWHGPDVSALSNEVSDYPVFFPKLKVFHPNSGGFCPAKPATKKYGKDCMVTFPSQFVRARTLEKCFALFHSQPVSYPHTQPLRALDPRDARRKFGTQ
jgi:hypothetical protein